MRQARRIGSDLEIYFEDTGRAWFRSNSGKQLAAVQIELADWQDFVDRWLQEVEEPRQRRLSAEERRLESSARGCVKAFRALGADRKAIEDLMTAWLPHIIAGWKDLTPEQIKMVVADAVSGS
jgi:hypothetical protein